MLLHLISLWLLFLPAAAPASREVPVYSDFSEFEPLLHQQNDTIYVINFWATWCKPCVKELPFFDKLTSEFPEEKIKVILVSLDFAEAKNERVIPFLEKKQIQSQVVILDDQDANAWIEKVDPSWSGAIPATVLYKNNHRSFFEKEFHEEELKQTIKQFIHDSL
ncbi:MAG: TlpA family protein disulfide reductase [Bacteroidota bacterium]|nr:TlpA family protein disulfide reductase [Bacteroidota bacterium]MDX5430166.1 TlpA family protein disulfide reductase [Bacteroidota bacterium]MDX5468931.1 TlpA family protein disulfide reductase [Bacteroidota bacterium]